MLSKHIPIGVVFKYTSHIKLTRGVHYKKSRFLGGKNKCTTHTKQWVIKAY